MYVSCSFDKSYNKYYSYRQENNCQETPAKWFVKKLKAIAMQVDYVHQNPKLMKPPNDQEKRRHDSNKCHICKKVILDQTNKVKDHDHLTSIYRGPAHKSCNLNYQDSRVLPVILHNFTNYDSHLFFSEINSEFKGEVSLLPLTKKIYFIYKRS